MRGFVQLSPEFCYSGIVDGGQRRELPVRSCHANAPRVSTVAERPGRLEPTEVRFLRNAGGHTQEEFGQLLGVAAETISRWENGKQTLGQQSELTLRMAVLVPAAVLEGVQKETAAPTQINVSDRKVVLAS